MSARRPAAPTGARTAVVVCSYTLARWELLRRAVQSLRAQTVAASEIIVVIDHEPELLVRARKELVGCIVVPNTGPKGLSGGRNSGLAAVSDAEIVAFIDDDAHADTNWLERLSDAFHDPTVVAAGGNVVPEWWDRRPAWFPEAFDWVVGCSYQGMPTTTGFVRNVIGCNMAFRAAPLRAIGGFSSRLGRTAASAAGAEETEVCVKLTSQYRGTKVLYEPCARVFHSVPASRATWLYFARRCLAEGRSKATLAGMVGTAAALVTERRYVTHVLPRAFAHAIGQGLRNRTITEAAGALAIAGGLSLTSAGYLWGRVMGNRPADADR